MLEAVALYGPASLDAITARMPRTRSSVYRALVDLENSGWIRRSINGRCFRVSSKLEKLADLHLSIAGDVSGVLDVLRSLLPNHKVVMSLVAHVKGHEFAVIDSSAFPLPLAVVDPDKQTALHDVLIALRQSGVLRGQGHARTPDEPHYWSLMDELSRNGFVFNAELEMSIVPVLVSSGDLVMIICENKNFAPNGMATVLNATDSIYRDIAYLDVFTFENNALDRLVAE